MRQSIKEELAKYKDLIVAGLDYYIAFYDNMPDKNNDEKTTSIVKMSVEHFNMLKKQTDELYKSKKLSSLKKWFRDISEMAVGTCDLNYQLYVEKTTGHKVDLFSSLFLRIDNIVVAGKITTDNQYRDVTNMIDFLSQQGPEYDAKIIVLDKLLFEYVERKKGKGGSKK